ncbi:hypothetical protein BOX15_Mlig002438g14 [Macrostomum lignano]|uniref:Uncharacterized protein n=1 Tax=Macrostomum lignano TaxID=282301 RepID=A0A267GHV0_9PLAT|nr:hypothetical protein BOX15_Mlig002438g14 [Macrostomum lignano]
MDKRKSATAFEPAVLPVDNRSAEDTAAAGRQMKMTQISLSASVPDVNIDYSGGGASGSAGLGATTHRRAQSASDISRVLSPDLRAMLMQPPSNEHQSGVDRLAGVEASVAWMFPPQLFSDKLRRVSTGGGDVDTAQMDRRVRKFYKQQDRMIDTYQKIYNDIVQADDPPVRGENGVDPDAADIEESDTRCSIRLAQLSFFINLALAIIKGTAIALSGSLSVVSSLIDSLIDLVSGIVVWIANRQVKSRNPYYYPQGKTRLEPIAIVILAVIMSTSTIQIIIKAIESIVNMAMDTKTVASNASFCLCDNDANGSVFVSGLAAGHGDYGTSWGSVFGLIGSVIILKLFLFVLCHRLGTTSSTGALALDHRNDCVSNATVLIMTVLSAYVWPYFDAIGALAISVYIIYTWAETLKQQIRLLTGYTADSEYLKQIIFICVNHHPLIQQLETVRAFHIGNNYLVEVDIVVPGDLALREAHDIGESLQRKLERLGGVERAFVHVDYEFMHHPSTEHKQV